MNRKVVIIGAGGHGKVIADIVKANKDFLVGYLDDDVTKNTIGVINDYASFMDAEFVIGIGDAIIREKFSRLPVKWYVGIHPSAIIGTNVTIGAGTVIMPNVVVNAGTVIGKHCIINTSAVVEHDNIISDFVHISVCSKTGGTVSIGKSTWIGIGATIVNNVSICEDCFVGAGAVVIKDIMEKGVYIGVPAKLK